MRRWTLYKRGRIYYVQFFNPETQKYLSARSTKAEDKSEAILIVARWLNEGIPDTRGGRTRSPHTTFTLDAALGLIRSEPFDEQDAARILEALRLRGFIEKAIIKNTASAELVETFLNRFWDYEISPYVETKRAHGQSIGRSHCQESAHRVERYWIPFFLGRRLDEIRKSDLRAFSLYLAKPERALAPATRNQIMVAGTTALKWAYTNEIISSDSTEGLATFSGKAKKRGILELEEAQRLFAFEWKDERSRVGNLLAATTGLRAGEVLALRLEDIGEVVIDIQHSWNPIDGLKTPKSGEARRVPVLPTIRTELLALAAKNPHGSDGKSFVFYSADAKHPMDTKLLSMPLKEALQALSLEGIQEEDVNARAEAMATLEERNIVFHSWRHFFSAHMADKLDAKKVRTVTGHKTASVFEGYADHELEGDIAAVGRAAADAFGQILIFKKEA